MMKQWQRKEQMRFRVLQTDAILCRSCWIKSAMMGLQLVVFRAGQEKMREARDRGHERHWDTLGGCQKS